MPGGTRGAVLFQTMFPLVPEQLPNLRDVPVFLSAGQFDTLVPTQQIEQLAQLLRRAALDLARRKDV